MARFLTDERAIEGSNSPAPVQVRDAALAAALRLTGQNPCDYGMSARDGRPARFDPAGYYLEDDAERTAESKREAAIKKWRERDAEPKKQPSPDGQRNQ